MTEFRCVHDDNDTIEARPGITRGSRSVTIASFNACGDGCSVTLLRKEAEAFCAEVMAAFTHAMKRYLITGEASAVRTLSDILCEPPYDWLVITDEGSSQRAILTMMEGLRAFQATTPECTIAYCFPDDPPSPSMVAAWEGQRWECGWAPKGKHPCALNGICFHDWGGAIQTALEAEALS